MTQALLARLELLRPELDAASDDDRAALQDVLDQIVQGLAATGTPVPAWVASRLHDRLEDEVEDQFDNMPL